MIVMRILTKAEELAIAEWRKRYPYQEWPFYIKDQKGVHERQRIEAEELIKAAKAGQSFNSVPKLSAELFRIDSSDDVEQYKPDTSTLENRPNTHSIPQTPAEGNNSANLNKPLQEFNSAPTPAERAAFQADRTHLYPKTPESLNPKPSIFDTVPTLPNMNQNEAQTKMTLPFTSDRASADRDRILKGLASLQKRMGSMGISLFPTSQWDSLGEAIVDGLADGRAPSDLPFFVKTPKDVEVWLGWLYQKSKLFPGMRDALASAQNRNREINAKWFQEHGYGGH